MARPSEDELIAHYLAPLAGPGGLGLKDDAALLTPEPGYDLVLTVDAIVEGVHFLPDDPPETLGAKALGVNLSDLAAKGAEPVGFLMVLALPDDWTEEWLAAFCSGLGTAATEVGCPLFGGDTVRAAGPLTISITAIGQVPAGTMVRRTTARPRDLVCVSGTIGDAALGLALLQGEAASAPWGASLGEEHRAYLTDRYRRPQPRLALTAALRTHASAAMDISDGLVGDLAKLLRAGGVTGTLDLDRIPLSPAAEAVLAACAPASVFLPPRGEGGPERSGRPDGGRGAFAGFDASPTPPIPDPSPQGGGEARKATSQSSAPALLDRIAGGGDDYEILFTLPPDRLDAMTRAAAAIGVAVTIVGEVIEGTGPIALRLNGSSYALATASFQHFGAVPA